jgi:hypothetical protein
MSSSVKMMLIIVEHLGRAWTAKAFPDDDDFRTRWA